MRRKPSRVPLILKRALLPAAAMTIMAAFGAYAAFGPNGVIALGDYKRQVAKRELQYAAIDQRREMLKNRVALVDPRHANPDMVDELVRRELNVAHPDDVIVPLR